MHVRKRCSEDRVPKRLRKESLIVGLSGERILFKKAKGPRGTARRMDLEGEIVLFYFSPSRRGRSREVSDRTSVSGVGPKPFFAPSRSGLAGWCVPSPFCATRLRL